LIERNGRAARPCFEWRQEERLLMTTLPASFRRIRLERAREPGLPDGDRRIGYWVLAPLDPEGRLDVAQARAHKRDCKVLRLRRDAEEEEGFLHRRPGGSWSFHYDFEDGGEDEDPGYRLGEHRFAEGEYVTIQEDDGAHTYRVAAVQPL
jgi:hypothetical protein